MQTILGSNGQIGTELAKQIHNQYTENIRLVSRKPIRVNETDELMSADLMNYNEAKKAIAGSEIVYFTVGLPMNSKLWESNFIIILDNVINACIKYNAKLVYLDNTYMLDKNKAILSESSEFKAIGRKSKVRSQMTLSLLKKMREGEINAVICRAPEFYGPGNTQSITNTMIFDKVINNKKINVPISESTKRSLIYTPDVSKALALIGNTADAFNQTWDLPCAPALTYKEIIEISSKKLKKKLNYFVIPMWIFKFGSLFSPKIKELLEILPRYNQDSIFLTDKFEKRFPTFKITNIEEGIDEIIK